MSKRLCWANILPLRDHGEKVLCELGLSFSQSRVYIALVRLADQSTAKEVSIVSNVARQDVYRTLSELQELSLVEMVIGNPAKFKAIPMQEVVSILIKRRKQKTRALMTEATDLVDKFPKKDAEAGIQQDGGQFILIPKKEALIYRTEKAIEVAQESIIVITSWRVLTQWLFILGKLVNQALIRGVNVRWITEKQENLTVGPELVETFKNSRFQLRTMVDPPKKRLVVYDGKEVFIATLREPNAVWSPVLWTNNSAIAYIINDYFEMKWKIASEYKPHKNRKNSEIIRLAP